MPMMAKARQSFSGDAVTIAYNKQIARNYDNERLIEPRRLDEIVKIAVDHTQRNRSCDPGDVKVLDLGCGTGFFTIPLAQRLPFQFTGADRSEEMLEIARSKAAGKGIIWDAQEATRLSYESQSFDLIFMSNFLHHFMNPLDVIEQCVRVLKPGGLLINHYGALEDIIKDPDHRFFQQAIELDVRRTPARIQMEYLLKSAGMTDITSRKGTYRLCHSAQERVKMVENKYISVFHMMDEMTFQRGLKELKRYAENSRFDPWLREIVLTTTCGIKA
ncbi:MAG: methyltransferase domain-containing protein [Candidatus Obscuribacter sp.]|nr:methyltransferase domain-containing protein [Candidatus Obscuribacter sp.]